jgi:hypothetical protein
VGVPDSTPTSRDSSRTPFGGCLAHEKSPHRTHHHRDRHRADNQPVRTAPPYFTNQAARTASAQHGSAIEAHSPLGHDGHIIIPKSARPERIAQNLAVFDFELTAEEIASIDALDKGEGGRVGPNPDTYAGQRR